MPLENKKNTNPSAHGRASLVAQLRPAILDKLVDQHRPGLCTDRKASHGEQHSTRKRASPEHGRGPVTFGVVVGHVLVDHVGKIEEKSPLVLGDGVLAVLL